MKISTRKISHLAIALLGSLLLTSCSFSFDFLNGSSSKSSSERTSINEDPMLSLTPSSCTLEVGESKTIIAATNLTDEVTFEWASADSAVCSVTPSSVAGQASISGLAVGEASINVTAGDLAGTCAVSVVAASGDEDIKTAKSLMEAGELVSNAIASGKSSVAITFAFNNSATISTFYNDMIELSMLVGSDFRYQYSTGNNITNRFQWTLDATVATTKTTKTAANNYKTTLNGNSLLRSGDKNVRSSTFSSFAYLGYTDSLQVDNSDELWWALEHKYIPTFASMTSPAKTLFDKALDICRTNVNDGMSEKEKARAIFEWITETCSYDHDAVGKNATATDQCYYLEGVFNNHRAVCDGFSKAYSLLCGIEGLDAVRAYGYKGDSGHAWNYIDLDDQWYLVCPTWGRTDASVSASDLSQMGVSNAAGLSAINYNALFTKASFFEDQGDDYAFEQLVFPEQKEAATTYDSAVFSEMPADGLDNGFNISSLSEMKTLFKDFAAAGASGILSFQVESSATANSLWSWVQTVAPIIFSSYGGALSMDSSVYMNTMTFWVVLN